MKKVPYGIINFKELREKGYRYVDKTECIEKLENYNEKVMYLRPGRFGKDLFDSLFKGT